MTFPISHIAQWRGNRPGLIEGLRGEHVKRGLIPLFSQDAPSSVPVAPAKPLEFQIDRVVMDRLYVIDPLAYEDATKASLYLSQGDASGLVVLRRLCERVVNRLWEKTRNSPPRNEPLAAKVEKLSKDGILQTLDLHCLTLSDS